MEKKTVLIVDDEVDMRIFLSTLFETGGYRPVAVRDGKEGIRKATDMAVDLIVLDVMMPGEGGVLMYKRLKTDDGFKEIPVIILSAVARRTFLHYLKMLNAQSGGEIPEPDHYMEKPPEADELLAVSGRLLDRAGPMAPAEISKGGNQA